MKYRCLDCQRWEEGEYQLIPIRQEDMGHIKVWRNEQVEILRQNKALNDEEQLRYWEAVLMPSFAEECPKQLLFTFLKSDECIGYGGLTHIDWECKRGEVSFLLDTSRTREEASYKNEFTIFLMLLKKAIFRDLGFHRMYAETFNVRPTHVEALERFGFTLEGTLKDHVIVNTQYCDSLIHGLINHE